LIVERFDRRSLLFIPELMDAGAAGADTVITDGDIEQNTELPVCQLPVQQDSVVNG